MSVQGPSTLVLNCCLRFSKIKSRDPTLNIKPNTWEQMVGLNLRMFTYNGPHVSRWNEVLEHTIDVLWHCIKDSPPAVYSLRLQRKEYVISGLYVKVKNEYHSSRVLFWYFRSVTAFEQGTFNSSIMACNITRCPRSQQKEGVVILDNITSPMSCVALHYFR
jgi:hypothetical protein